VFGPITLTAAPLYLTMWAIGGALQITGSLTKVMLTERINKDKNDSLKYI